MSPVLAHWRAVASIRDQKRFGLGRRWFDNSDRTSFQSPPRGPIAPRSSDPSWGPSALSRWWKMTARTASWRFSNTSMTLHLISLASALGAPVYLGALRRRRNGVMARMVTRPALDFTPIHFLR